MMQMKVIITFHVCLILIQLRIFPLSWLYYWKKAKKLPKIAFRVESKVEFLGELNVKTREVSTSWLLYI